jgi:two-component system, OmpR family, KDP operon response regulator KdpE
MHAGAEIETILVVDDEPQIRRAVGNALGGAGRRIVEAATGREALDLAASARPDAIVLDLGLPDLDGIDICREIRHWANMPIVVLSARHSDQEKVRLLNAGADDYVTKPFSTTELAARVNAQIRRASAPRLKSEAEAIVAGDLAIDLPRRVVLRQGERVRLTPIEWDILSTLVSARGRTLTHQHIFDAVWAQPYGSPQQYLRVHITNIRRKIERDPSRPELIVTEPGVGYRFENG